MGRRSRCISRWSWGERGQCLSASVRQRGSHPAAAAGVRSLGGYAMTERGRRPAEIEAGWAIDTLLIHGNQGADPETGAVVPPIHPASTFARKSMTDGA